ncbi:MAG: hypothetical protein QOH70_949 [Blastocatellia bacterium]|jgi:uncharacterized membrane protein|nr:hypothetical protein [Blastocatellia bacterium]
MEEHKEINEVEAEEVALNSFQKFKKTRTWGFIEVVSPIIAIVGGIVLPIALYLYSEKAGQVTVRGIQQTSLINTKSGLGNDVSIVYREKKVANLLNYTFEIANTGNTDIDKSDVHYFRWIPPPSTQILDARIIGKTGGGGEFLAVNYSARELDFDILTLNKGVSARITILCSSDAQSPNPSDGKIDAVIKGAAIVDQSSNFDTEHQPSFISNILAGGFWTNVAKLLIFFLVGVLLLFLILIPWIKVMDWRRARRSEETKRRDEAKQKELEAQRKELENRQKQLVRQLRRHLASDAELEELSARFGRPFNDLDLKYISECVNFFSELSPEQLQVCEQILKQGESDVSKLILGSDLTEEQKTILSSAPNLDVFFYSIFRFPSLYKPQVALRFLSEEEV